MSELSLCRSVGGFHKLPRQFERILTSKERNGGNILLVELGNSTQEIEVGCFVYC